MSKRESWSLVSYEVHWWEPGKDKPDGRFFGLDKAKAKAFCAGKKERGLHAEVFRVQVLA